MLLYPLSLLSLEAGRWERGERDKVASKPNILPPRKGGRVPQCFLARVVFKATDELKLWRPAEKCLFEPEPDFLCATAVGWQPIIRPWHLAACLNVAALLLIRLLDFPKVWMADSSFEGLVFGRWYCLAIATSPAVKRRSWPRLFKFSIMSSTREISPECVKEISLNDMFIFKF